jgi:hypothetical protein
MDMDELANEHLDQIDLAPGKFHVLPAPPFVATNVRA